MRNAWLGRVEAAALFARLYRDGAQALEVQAAGLGAPGDDGAEAGGAEFGGLLDDQLGGGALHRGEGEILTGLSAGQRAQLLGREGDWYHVRLSDGEEGYVSARWTQPLD